MDDGMGLRIGIVGAGMGGLAAAALLARRGHAVTLVERFAVPRPVGSGLVVQPVGLAVLDAVGAGDAARELGAPLRQMRGDESMGSHLCLLVDCEGPRLVDGGFGSFLGAPLPLVEGSWQQAPLPVSLGKAEDGLWRLQVAIGANAMSYDFTAEPANEDQLSALCHWQASDPASVFVQNLTAQRREEDRYLMLRGKVLSVMSTAGEERRELASASELVDTLRTLFLLDVPEAAELWPAIEARHEALFGPQAAPTT